MILISSQAQPEGLSTFTLQSESAVLCWYWGGSFKLPGQPKVQLQWSTKSEAPTAVDLYVTTPLAAGQKWFCDSGPEWSSYNSAAFGSGTSVTPGAGTYLLLVVNYSMNTVTVSATFTAANGSIAFSTTDYGQARQPPYLFHHCNFLPDCG